MGAFYNSYSVKGNVHEETRRVIISWLNAKGFELANTLPVTELDQNNERGVFLYWNKKWVVILYSNIEEESRLLFDLKQIEAPLLHTWVHDSDVWGYELYNDSEMVTAFISNPKYLSESFSEEAPNDIEKLCELCEIPDEMETVFGLQRKNNLFREQICEKFAELLGVPPAASSYAYNESDLAENNPSGFHKEHLVFRPQNWDPMYLFDIHKFSVSSIQKQKEEELNKQQMNENAMEKKLSDIRQTAFWVHKAFGCLSLIIKPVLMVIYSPFFISKWIQRTLGFNRGSNMLSFKSRKKMKEMNATYRVMNDFIVNERHSCRIRLTEGAVVNYDPVGSTSISFVFAFQVDNIMVSCRTFLPNTLEYSLSFFPPDVNILEENRTVSSMKAKMIRIIIDIEGMESFREFHAIQAPKAIYVLDIFSESKPDEETLSKIHSIIDSFEFVKIPTPQKTM